MNERSRNNGRRIRSEHAKLIKTVMCAFFTALTVVCSQIAIPTPWGVPINLALFSVYLSGALLGAFWGTLSMVLYVLLALAGVPVLAGLRGGASAVFGVTGGYIVGYILAAFAVGLIARLWGRSIAKLITACSAGCFLCYLFGTVWFSIYSDTGFFVALSLCVLPYLIGDALKIAVCAVISSRLYKHLPAELK